MGVGKHKYTYCSQWYSIWHAAAKMVLIFFIYAFLWGFSRTANENSPFHFRYSPSFDDRWSKVHRLAAY